MGVLTPGAVVGGCRIEGVVGRGGMGVVYLARQLELERDVALKVISPELTEDPIARGRFLAEARAAAAVEHPNVVPVHAVGTSDDLAYLVMRLIRGDDLRTVVRRDGPLDPERAAAIAERIGDALDAIHRAGYVHRDVKPPNVLIDDDGHVYLSDFGLAKAALATRGPTSHDHWVGTLDYVAPEQIRGEPVDARTDVYALGGVLHFMLTGRPPFDHEGDEAKLWAHLHEPPPRPSELAGVSPAFDALVARALAKDAAQRQVSAGELGRAARAVARGEPVAAPTITARRPRTRARPAGVWGWIAGLILAAGAGAAIAVLAQSDEDAGRPAAFRPTPTPTAAPDPRSGSGDRGRPALTFEIERKRFDNVGSQPADIAAAGADAWIISRSRERVVWMHGAESRRPRADEIGGGAVGVAADGKSVWIALDFQRRVVRLDARTGELVDELRLDGEPIDVAVGRTGLWIAVRNRLRGPATLEHRTKAGAEIAAYTIDEGIADLEYGDGSVWVALENKKRILRAVAGQEPITHAWLPAQPAALAYGRGQLWATVGADAVTRIDPETEDALTVSVPSRTGQLGVWGHHLVVARQTSDELLVFDVRRWRPGIKPAKVKVPLNPFAVEAAGDRIWVTGLVGKWALRLER